MKLTTALKVINISQKQLAKLLIDCDVVLEDQFFRLFFPIYFGIKNINLADDTT